MLYVSPTHVKVGDRPLLFKLEFSIPVNQRFLPVLFGFERAILVFAEEAKNGSCRSERFSPTLPSQGRPKGYCKPDGTLYIVRS